jgi:histidine decarboxylase
MSKRRIFLLSILVVSRTVWAGEVDMKRLDDFAQRMLAAKAQAVGYPINQNVDLKDFYLWYAQSGLADLAMNNVGNPRKTGLIALNTHQFENEVIDFFAPLYGFAKDDTWGIVTNSGTDGNNHGIYFGVQYLHSKTKERPILYELVNKPAARPDRCVACSFAPRLST